jgi:hypothetical protein
MRRQTDMLGLLKLLGQFVAALASLVVSACVMATLVGVAVLSFQYHHDHPWVTLPTLFALGVAWCHLYTRTGVAEEFKRRGNRKP